MRRSQPLALVLALAALAGCAKHATEPPPDTGGGASTVLIATQPPARSTGALYDGDIWGQFDRPLDSRTVSVLTVFLKLDGQRIPSAVSYDGITRRVFVRPTVTLQLQRTYTVEFTPSVKALDGTPLPAGVFFQFTTNSLRRVAYDYPAQGALEGPLVTLGWGGAQGPVNQLFYEVYASTDSIAVENRALAALQRSVFTRHLPALAWPRGATVYWAVTSENLDTNERLLGPVRSFRVVDAAAALDSVTLLPRDHGSNDIRNRNTQYCGNVALPAGPGFNAAIRWDYSRIPANARIVGATMKLVTTDPFVGTIPSTQPAVWMAQNDWLACSIIAPGPPYNEPSGFLAQATAVDASHAEFTSDRFGAFVEAQFRLRTLLYGVLVRTNSNVLFHSPLSTTPNAAPRVVVRFHLPPPGVSP